MPFDPHLEEGAEISLERLRRETREALIELAAVVADGFPARSGITTCSKGRGRGLSPPEPAQEIRVVVPIVRVFGLAVARVSRQPT